MSKETPAGELLPCPFCGSSASGYAIEAHSHALKLADGFKMPDHGGSYVVEGDCGCGSGMIGETQQEVTLRWNRRAADRELRQGDAIDASPERDEKPAADTPMPPVAWVETEYEEHFGCDSIQAYRSEKPGWEALVRQSDAQAALVAKDAEIDALKESGPIMPRGSDGNGTLITGTMKQILQDYRSAADFEAGEVDRLNSNLAAQAVELERLTAERDGLREALQEMVSCFDPYAWGSPENKKDALQNARAAIAKEQAK